MSNLKNKLQKQIVDKRIKCVANNENTELQGQEYAHKYYKKDEYEYLDEKNRLNNTMNDSNKNKVESPITSKEQLQFKVVSTDVNKKLQDHKNNVYKINTSIQSPIRACSDNKDSYKIENDPRQDEINYINNGTTLFDKQLEIENQTNLSNPNERYNLSKVDVENKLYNKPNNIKKQEDMEIHFNINDSIKHIEEGITGSIKFIGEEKIAVVWDDNTRERFSIAEAKKYLMKVSNNNCTPSTGNKINNDINITIENIEKPISRNIQKSTPIKSTNLDSIDAALNEYLQDDDFEDVEDANPNKQFLEDKNEQTKESATKQLIGLMKDKGLIKNINEQNEYYDKIIKMDDSEYEEFKNDILQKESQIQVSEAELMLKKIRKSGPVIGDFSKSSIAKESLIDDNVNIPASINASVPTNNIPNTINYSNYDNYDDDVDISDNGTRSLRKNNRLDKIKQNINNVGNIMDSLDNAFENILVAKVNNMENVNNKVNNKPIMKNENLTHKVITNQQINQQGNIQRESHTEKQVTANKQLNLSGFQDLKGITKPIQVVSKEKSLGDYFKDLNWTTKGGGFF